MVSKTFGVLITELHPILNFVEEYCLQENIDSDNIYDILLSMEEAIVNIMQHGFHQKEGFIKISCQKDRKEKMLMIDIWDCAIAYNPFQLLEEYKKSNPSGKKKDMEPGGLGVFFYSLFMDVLEYQRENGLNHIHFVKYLK